MSVALMFIGICVVSYHVKNKIVKGQACVGVELSVARFVGAVENEKCKT